MVQRKVMTFFDDFRRAQALTSTPGHNGWTAVVTTTAGTPTHLAVSGGGMKLTLDSDDEVEVVTMGFNDVLTYGLAKLQHIEFVALVGAIDALTVLTLGVGSARAADEDAVANNAWFKLEGAASTSNIVVETDDGTNDNNDVATGKTLGATALRLGIDFTRGLADVRFHIDNDPVAGSTTFDMSNATGNVQPYIQLSKPSGTGVPTVTIKQFTAQYEIAD